MAAPSCKLECDLVMRGGITSGIVYPKAIAKLAETYRFRSIGGTSAGAIAAASTAAAAYGERERQAGRAKESDQDPFQTRLKNLPEELATERDGKTVLERLFQPDPGMKPLFRVLMASLQGTGPIGRLFSICRALYRYYWAWAILGMTISAIPIALSLSLVGFRFTGSTWLEWMVLAVTVLSALPIAFALGLCATILGVRQDIVKLVPANSYGLCSGSGSKDSTGTAPLTDWVHELFQSLAGRGLDDDPLTFGDLWDTRGDEREERDIDLVLMTTNATRGVSHRFPFLEGYWGPLYVNKTEFERLFPRNVVEWMKTRRGPRCRRIVIGKDFFRLPRAADIPIIVGVRMSLSFPFLLTAVPLYAPSYNKEGEKVTLRRCWFSDGGLTSNFPIHFFDGPLPSRPTFGINLVPATVDVMEKDKEGGLGRLARQSQAGGQEKAWQYVWMPRTNRDGVQYVARFTNIKDDQGGSIVDFFMMLFDTTRNWGDTELMAMPGYRDRIVHVALSEEEGLLNLNMPEETIRSIGERGALAGTLLTERFSLKRPRDRLTGNVIQLTWDNHRWVRYRSIMAAIEDLARRFQNKWDGVAPKGQPRSYPQLLNRRPTSKPRSYPFGDQDHRRFAEKITTEFVSFIKNAFDAKRSFDLGNSDRQGRSPRPKPRLRVMPPGSSDPREERF